LALASLLMVSPYITMPLLGVAMAGRWASFNPILIKRFPDDFGAAYGSIVSLSEFITLILSLVTSFLVNETGSYIDTLIGVAVLQLVGVAALLNYIRASTEY
jgi:hypothetical protein